MERGLYAAIFILGGILLGLQQSLPTAIILFIAGVVIGLWPRPEGPEQ